MFKGIFVLLGRDPFKPPRERGVTVQDMVLGFIVCDRLQPLPNTPDVIGLKFIFKLSFVGSFCFKHGTLEFTF